MIPNEDKTVIVTLKELNVFVLKAIKLSKDGYKVAGLSEIDGKLSVYVENVEDPINLQIDANLN